ncbi:MAG: hypothetical protein JWP55_4968 [Mycobacterium sp.]|nr:hypothetical protein [Mycobacterium sp.]
MLGVLIAPGCATSTASPPPTATSTTAVVAPNELALATLNDIVQGDPAAATANFDQTMRRLLSPDARGKITVVNVPLQMQNAPGQFRLSVRTDGQIAGLYFLKEGVPVP